MGTRAHNSGKGGGMNEIYGVILIAKEVAIILFFAVVIILLVKNFWKKDMGVSSEKVEFDIHSFDARVWSESFCKQFPGHDESTMLGWFANSIMAGYDHGKKDGE